MLLKYCPKRLHFHYGPMKARLMLAALDWNSKSREAVRDEEGNIKRDMVYSKRRKMWVNKTRYRVVNKHLEPLMDRVVKVAETGIKLPALHIPENAIVPHIASTAKPEGSSNISRFAH